MNNSYKPASTSEILRLLIRNYKLLFLLPILIAGTAAIATLYMDDIYKSSASLLPAEERKIGLESILGGNLGGLAGNLMGGGGRRSSFDRYIVLLNSESVKIEVIEKFNLVELYEMEDNKYPLLRTMEKLEDNTNFRGQTEGNFRIEVWDKDPERAREMVEFYIGILNRFNNEISLREATAYREFVEQRYNRAFREVDSLRFALADFQREYGVFELNEQVVAYFNLLGEITVEQLQAELALDLLESTVGKNNNAYKQAEQRLEAINRNLNRNLVRSDANPIFLNIEKLPEIGVQYFNLMQNIELQAEILKFIVPMFEQALLEEQKALPIVSVVDYPRISEKKDKPFRTLIVVAVLLSSFLVIAVALILQYTYKLNKEYIQTLIRE
jgi:tyrosine-protein kinase Etk/Wzc